MRAFLSEKGVRKLSIPESQGRERIAAQEALDIMDEIESLTTGYYAPMLDVEELHPGAFDSLIEGLDFLCTILPSYYTHPKPKQTDYL